MFWAWENLRMRRRQTRGRPAEPGPKRVHFRRSLTGMRRSTVRVSSGRKVGIVPLTPSLSDKGRGRRPAADVTFVPPVTPIDAPMRKASRKLASLDLLRQSRGGLSDFRFTDL